MDQAARRRFARQLLLVEIGEAGQERLLRARARLAAGAEPRAAGVAREYLERAGAQVTGDGSEAGAVEVAVPDAAAVRALAGAPELESAAAAIAGAFAAVEAIKAALAIGTPAALPHDLRLRAEVAP